VKYTEKQINEVLRHDPLAAAEKISGKSIHGMDANDHTLSFDLSMRHIEAKQRMLEASGDITYKTTLEEYIKIIEANDFFKILEEPFGDGETCYTYWNPEGILLFFETYGKVRINSGKAYYCIKFNEGVNRAWLTSSGTFKDGIWCGDHGSSEALLHNLNQLRKNGEFQKIWPKDAWTLWLINYHERNECVASSHNCMEQIKAMRRVCDDRVSRLPEQVRKAINK
jgi:hypothetical protein